MGSVVDHGGDSVGAAIWSRPAGDHRYDGRGRGYLLGVCEDFVIGLGGAIIGAVIATVGGWWRERHVERKRASAAAWRFRLSEEPELGWAVCSSGAFKSRHD
jgi:hypothetical protein